MQETRAVLLSNTVHQHPGNPTVCRPQLNAVEAIPEGLEQTGDKNRMLQLRFVSNNPKSTLYTGRIVKWKNGRNVKVAIFENDNQVRHGDISKVKVDIVAVRSDFFTKQGQEYFTKEEFERQICTNGDEELVLATVNLNDGECYLDSFFFTVSSHRQRWRLAARVNSQVPRVRFKEAITDPFVVKVGRSKSNAKSYPPKKGDDVYRLEKISRKGKVRDNLMGEGITNVKHLLRHYYKDGSALKKLTHMANKTWKTMITHAKTCKPGNELYAYSAIEENCVVFFNDFYDLVGVKLDGAYTPYGNLNQSQKVWTNILLQWHVALHKYALNYFVNSMEDKVIKYKMAAHKMFEELEKEGSLNHGYEMIDGHPSPVASNGVGPSTQTTLTSQQYSHYQNQGFGHCQPSPPQNGSYLSAPIFQNNMVVPSAQETPASERSYDQNVDKEFGNQNPFSQHNGLSNCNFPGNVLNQCSFASQPPSAIPGQYNDLIRDSSQGFQINGSLCLTSSGTGIDNAVQ
uniref:Uncharacterized protein n=1 Tax=Leersia perrieri TaxID=77586 RepID=A0A0D9VZP9_9ORYZ